MEIEAKFAVPDEYSARKLRAVQSLDNLSCGAPERLVVRDTFFDTRALDLARNHHVLRIRRRSDGRTFVTFKEPSRRHSGVHSRPETEVEIPSSRLPRILNLDELPPRIKNLVGRVATQPTFYPLLSISQTRDIKIIRRSRRTIAEWSVDYVKFRAGKRRRSFYELEIELKRTGTAEDLDEMVRWVEREFQLQPMPESKFSRALRFMRDE